MLQGLLSQVFWTCSSLLVYRQYNRSRSKSEWSVAQDLPLMLQQHCSASFFPKLPFSLLAQLWGWNRGRTCSLSTIVLGMSMPLHCLLCFPVMAFCAKHNSMVPKCEMDRGVHSACHCCSDSRGYQAMIQTINILVMINVSRRNAHLAATVLCDDWAARACHVWWYGQQPAASHQSVMCSTSQLKPYNADHPGHTLQQAVLFTYM